MYKVTGRKRTNEQREDHNSFPQALAVNQAPAPLNTSRCTLQEVPSHPAFLQEPPAFPCEPLNPYLGIGGWLPPSLFLEIQEMRYEHPMGEQEKAPDRLSASHIPPAVIVPPAADTDLDTDAQFLEQLDQACDALVQWTGRTNAAVRLLKAAKTLDEAVTLLMKENDTGGKLAQNLLYLLDYCGPDTRAHRYVMSLFLVMKRAPVARHHRMSFIVNLPPTLSRELQCHAPAVQAYWVRLANGRRGKQETQELAGAVCKHFGW